MKKRLMLCLVLVCLFIFYHFFQYGVLGQIECYIDDKKITPYHIEVTVKDSYHKIIETDKTQNENFYIKDRHYGKVYLCIKVFH